MKKRLFLLVFLTIFLISFVQAGNVDVIIQVIEGSTTPVRGAQVEGYIEGVNVISCETAPDGKCNSEIISSGASLSLIITKDGYQTSSPTKRINSGVEKQTIPIWIFPEINCNEKCSNEDGYVSGTEISGDSCSDSQTQKSFGGTECCCTPQGIPIAFRVIDENEEEPLNGINIQFIGTAISDNAATCGPTNENGIANNCNAEFPLEKEIDITVEEPGYQTYEQRITIDEPTEDEYFVHDIELTPCGDDDCDNPDDDETPEEGITSTEFLTDLYSTNNDGACEDGGFIISNEKIFGDANSYICAKKEPLEIRGGTRGITELIFTEDNSCEDIVIEGYNICSTTTYLNSINDNIGFVTDISFEENGCDDPNEFNGGNQTKNGKNMFLCYTKQKPNGNAYTPADEGEDNEQPETPTEDIFEKQQQLSVTNFELSTNCTGDESRLKITWDGITGNEGYEHTLIRIREMEPGGSSFSSDGSPYISIDDGELIYPISEQYAPGTKIQAYFEFWKNEDTFTPYGGIDTGKNSGLIQIEKEDLPIFSSEEERDIAICVDDEAIDPTCEDTDEGKEDGEKGTITFLNAEGEEETEEDICINKEEDEYVREYFCTDAGTESYEDIKCEYGCEEGACLSEAPEEENEADTDILTPILLAAAGAAAGFFLMGGNPIAIAGLALAGLLLGGGLGGGGLGGGGEGGEGLLGGLGGIVEGLGPIIDILSQILG